MSPRATTAMATLRPSARRASGGGASRLMRSLERSAEGEGEVTGRKSRERPGGPTGWGECHPERSQGDHAEMAPFTSFRVTCWNPLTGFTARSAPGLPSPAAAVETVRIDPPEVQQPHLPVARGGPPDGIARDALGLVHPAPILEGHRHRPAGESPLVDLFPELHHREAVALQRLVGVTRLRLPVIDRDDPHRVLLVIPDLQRVGAQEQV